MTGSSPRCSLWFHSLMHSQKSLLYRNRTNSWYRTHMYFLTCFFPLYVASKISFNTHLFSYVVIMTLNYDVCPIPVQNMESCTFCRNISIFPASAHSGKQHHNLTTLPLYQTHTGNTERRCLIGSWIIVVREIATHI